MNAERSAAWVRRWVSVYTLGLPPEIKQRRRDEIDDDLWCQAQEAAGAGRADRSLGGEIVARLVFGVPADLSWRIEQRRYAARQAEPRRLITVNAPGRALLAILGGIGWTVWPIPQAIVGVTWPEGDPLSMVLFVSVIGGTLALAGAIGGFVALAPDRIRTWVAVAASVGAVLGVLGVFAVSPIIVLIPVSSALLMWELRRIGLVGIRLALAHIAAAVVVVAVFAVILNSTVLLDRATAVPALSLAIPYGLSWIAIGWSLLRRPSGATDGMAGASAA
jgi:hypothetical protein